MVAVTDYWPQEEGYIVEGSPVVLCKATSAITEMACVRLTATTAGQVSVGVGAAWGDCIGVALRACDNGGMVPVAFSGVVKMLADATLALGQHVCNQATGGNKIIDAPAVANVKLGANGSAYLLGTALQAAFNDGEDEILILLGRK
jgi:hypothetical protein